MRAIIPQAFTNMRTKLIVLVLPWLLAGCVYRMNIQQGNYLEGKTVDQLQTGMTRSQVRYLLGTPMAPDIFNHDRWDYVYYLKKGRLRGPEKRRLIVHFQDDKVASVDRTGVPATAELPMPDRDQPPRATDIAPSEPRVTQPENPSSTQPGTPQPPKSQTPDEPPPEPAK